MSYKYDMFLSYKHYAELRSWVFDIFFPELISSVELELGRKIKIFKDIEEISPTEIDESTLIAELGRGLVHSRCMVAIWSPSYFHSRWCWGECRSFVKRAEEHSDWSGIFPVVIHNGNLF